jgi:thiol-disulfide isomerase/thioredoxin
MSWALKGKAVTSIVLLLLVGSGVVAACGGSGLQEVEGPHMLYFYAEWWPICQQMAPIVDGLEETYGEDFPIVRVDIDTREGKELAREQGFIGQPTFILFDRSLREVRRLMGPVAVETFQEEIERLLQEW